MALIQFSGGYNGPEYDPSNGEVGFINYGTNVADAALAASFPPTICMGFSGNLTFGGIQRDFTTDRNRLNFLNVTAGTRSTPLVISPTENQGQVEFLNETGGAFSFAPTDRLQLVCGEADAQVGTTNLVMSTWIERVGDTDDYFMIVSGAKGEYLFPNNPYSYGAGASTGVAPTSTTGITFPVDCALTFAALSITSSGRDTPLADICRINIYKNGILNGAMIVDAGNLVEVFSDPPITYNTGDIYSLQAATTNADLISAVMTATFRKL